MRKMLIVISILISCTTTNAQSKDEAAVRKVLAVQSAAWNRGDLDEFMQGYWKNDSLMFIGKSGVTYGWQNTLDNYKKGYPDTASMGKLNFTLLHVKRLSGQYFYIVGKWHLQRTIGDVGGHFNLIFKKVDGKWVIISDHSS